MTILGHDEDGIFTYKNTKNNIDSDSELFYHVALPKDICAAAAIRSRGSVFSANQLTDARPAHQTRFVNIMTSVWAAGAEPTKVQECSCVVDTSNAGKAICRNGETRNFFMKVGHRSYSI